MKTTNSGWLAVALMAAPVMAQAAVTFSTDTATDLVGTFSVTGTSTEFAVPGVFDFGLSFCLPVRASRGATATVGLQCAGSPDNPRVSLQDVQAGPRSGSPVSGSTSSLGGGAVPTFHFHFSDLQDTGGASGTFSGSFCFSRSPTGCASSVPEESATLAGFYPPVEPPSVATNNAKAGHTIPFKFYAETTSGPIDDLAAANLTIASVACTDVSTAADPVEEYSADTGVALVNMGGGYYQYNWKTSKADAGTCKTVTLSLPQPYSSPTSPTATFKFY
jgi:hypothetical protein